MKMRKLVLSASLCLLLATAFGPRLAAAETIRFRQDDLLALATFSTQDPTLCILTEVHVTGIERSLKEGSGGSVEGSEASVTISQYDQCTDTFLIAAFGRQPIASEALTIDGFESATLNAAVEVFDEISGSTSVVTINVSWAGEGETLDNRIHIHQYSRAFTWNFRFDGTERQASAVGEVVFGSTNLTPEPGVDNLLWHIRAGSVSVKRN
jgi:hypothetical protein